MGGRFTVEHRPAADGAVWTVLSPGGVSVARFTTITRARSEAAARNGETA